MKARMVYLMICGLLLILLVIVVGDGYIALKENRGPHESIVTLVQNALVAMTAVISSYFARSNDES